MVTIVAAVIIVNSDSDMLCFKLIITVSTLHARRCSPSMPWDQDKISDQHLGENIHGHLFGILRPGILGIQLIVNLLRCFRHLCS